MPRHSRWKMPGRNAVRARPRLEALEARVTPAILALDATNIALAASASLNEGGPDIAMRADGGGFVVTYTAPDAGSTGIYFQRYDANWQAVGGATAVNTVTTNAQLDSSIGMDPAGNFVIAWRSSNQVSGSSGSDVYARRYNANGTAIDTAEFLVNTGATAGDQADPDVAVNASGRFVIAFLSGPVFLAEDMYAKGYTGITVGGSGTPTVAFAEALVSIPANSPEDQFAPAVAIDAAGNFVVAYNSFNQVGGTAGGAELVARRMNANGTPNGTEFLVNTVTTGGQGGADIGMDSAGNFTIVFTSAVADTGGTSPGVLMQRYNSSGVAQGGNTLVNTGFTSGSQGTARIAMAAGGDFVVTWTSEETDNDGLGNDSYYKKYNSAGTVLIADTLVNTGTTVLDDQQQTNAVPGITTSGDFVIPFEGVNPSLANFDVYLRRFAEAPVALFSSATYSITETNVNAPVVVSRTGAAYALAVLSTSVTVSRTGGTATAGSDYTSVFPATFTIAAGSASQTLNVPILDDTLVEAAETIAMSLAVNTAGHTLGSPSAATLTINDNDAAASVTITGGNDQTATVGAAFGSALTVAVRNAGSQLVQGATVTFTAPASGASAVFSNSTNTVTVTTNASGVATSSSVSANLVAGGSYAVTASAGVPSATFTLTNAKATVSGSATALWGTAPAALAAGRHDDPDQPAR